MNERTYRCPNCGSVKTITQQEADESRVLQGEIPAFIICMDCPDKKHHYDRIRVWAEGEKDRDLLRYTMYGTRSPYKGFDRAMRRKLKKKVDRI